MATALHVSAAGVHVWRVELYEDDPRASSALRGILARYLGEEAAAIELREGELGKPAMAKAPPRLHFNLSHSGGLALVAVARERQVGVDLEDATKPRDFAGLARRWLDPPLAAKIEATPPESRGRAFYAAWTRHEAARKCLGTGLGAGAGRQVPTVALDVGPAHAAALAIAAEANAMLP